MRLNRKEILKAAWQNLMNHFWIYIVAGILLFLVVGIGDGYIDFIIAVQNLLISIKSGSFNAEQLTNFNSELWTGILSSSGLGAFGIFAAIFAANPLKVGFSKVFLQGKSAKPEIQTMFSVFKKNYANTTLVSIIAEMVFSILSFAILIAYSICMVCLTGLFSVLTNSFGEKLFTGAHILMIVFALILTGLYFIWIMNIKYNFYFLNYVLASENPLGFPAAYITSKNLAQNNKLKIFMSEWHIIVGKGLTILIPAMIFGIGIILTLYEKNGLEFILIGIFMIVPMVFLNLYFSVCKETICAEIYTRLKPIEKTVSPTQNK